MKKYVRIGGRCKIYLCEWKIVKLLADVSASCIKTEDVVMRNMRVRRHISVVGGGKGGLTG